MTGLLLWLHHQALTHVSQDMQSVDLSFPCLGIDTHAHLNLKPLRQDLKRVLVRAKEAGVRLIGNVFLNHQAYLQDKELFQEQEQVFFLLGVHPHEAHLASSQELQGISQEFLQEPRLRALGEIGLDFYRLRQEKSLQIKAFKDQLALARELELPVVIHCREAEHETLEILQDLGFAHRPLLWHCFGRDRQLAEEIVSQGWSISVPGIVTFPKAWALHQAVASIPLKSLHLETDCPFLAPEPWRGKTNEPSLLPYSAYKVAELQGVHPEYLWEMTAANSREFFSLQSQ